MLSLLALTAALASRSAVTPSYLRLRGGDVDTVTNGMALLQVASGTFAFMAPERNIEMYGYDKEPTKVEVAMMRYLAVGQVVLGATSVAGLEGGSKAAQAMSLSGGAASLLACAPVFEALGGPKQPLAAWIAALAVLGKATRAGKVKSVVPGTVLGGIAAAQALVAPDKTWEAYKNKLPATEMALALFSLAGGNLLANTAYVAVADKQGHKKGLCAGLALLAANCVKFAVLDATRVGFKPAGAFVWGAITAAGALALKA